MQPTPRATGSDSDSAIAKNNHQDGLFKEKREGAKLQSEGLRVGWVDRVSSLLVTMIVASVGVVALMLVLFLAQSAKEPRFGDVTFRVDQEAGRGDHAFGFKRDFAALGESDIQTMTEPSMQLTLASVSEVAHGTLAALETMGIDSDSSSGSNQAGDSRRAGPLSDGENISRSERWELKFAAYTEAGYAAQLDAFQFELGIVGGGISTVDYVSHFTGPLITRQGFPAEEKRLHFAWRQDGALPQLERRLVKRAGVAVENRMILKFLSPELEAKLARIELENANQLLKRSTAVGEILKTIFECRPVNSSSNLGSANDANARGITNKYEWVVLDQRFRIAG